MSSEDRETLAKTFSTPVIEVLDTNTNTKDHSLLELGLKRQGLYYASLQIFNVKQIALGAWLWPSGFVPSGVCSLLI